MQDVHPFGAGGARMFAGGGDRRLRPNHLQAAVLAPLKCPRCGSLNTKFCYYNNYNLSQPRHFCKSCRRYWTKGGVLRNVPVGGGSRKIKRSKAKASASEQRKSNSHSSSESSSITATTTAVGTAEVLSESINPPSFDQPLMDHSMDGQIFQELGSFTTLMTSSDDPSLIDFTNTADVSTRYRLQQSHPGKDVENHWGQPPKMDGGAGKTPEITAAGFLDDTAEIDIAGLHRQNRRSNGGLSPLDWQIGGGHGLFDLTGAVDQSYWSQTQWGANGDDHSLNYLP